MGAFSAVLPHCRMIPREVFLTAIGVISGVAIYFFLPSFIFPVGKGEKMLHASKGEAQFLEFVRSLKGMSGIPVPSCRWLSSEVCWMWHCFPCHPSLPKGWPGGMFQWHWPLWSSLGRAELWAGHRTELWTGQGTGQISGQDRAHSLLARASRCGELVHLVCFSSRVYFQCSA